LTPKSETLSPHIKLSFHPPDKDLPVDHFSLAGAKVPLYTYLLSLCSRGIKKTWSDQRNVAGDKKNFKVSSMGWQRV